MSLSLDLKVERVTV